MTAIANPKPENQKMALYLDAKLLVERVKQIERDKLQLAQEVYALVERAKTVLGVDGYGVYSWLDDEFGMERTTGYKYWDIGFALQAGIEPLQQKRGVGLEQLADAGKALRNGVNKDTVQQAVNEGKIKQTAQAAMQHGTLAVRTTLEGGTDLDALLLKKLRGCFKAAGLQIESPEVRETAVRYVLSRDDTEVIAWIKNGMNEDAILLTDDQIHVQHLLEQLREIADAGFIAQLLDRAIKQKAGERHATQN